MAARCLVLLGACASLLLLLAGRGPGIWPRTPLCPITLRIDEVHVCAREVVPLLYRPCAASRGWTRRMLDARFGDHWSRSSCRRVGRLAQHDLEALEIVIDIQAAEREDLISLPGIGPKLAGRILEARAQGNLSDMQALDEVSGIGPLKLERLQHRACFGCAWLFPLAVSTGPDRRDVSDAPR